MRYHSALASILTAVLLSCFYMTSAQAQAILRVPQEIAGLQQAINSIPNGGIIEISAGTYPAPANGFRIRNLNKTFTIRAVGGQVTLDGEGSKPILRIENGQRVILQGLSFRDGVGTSETDAGAVTIDGAEVSILDCQFDNNRTQTPTTGGGAVRIFEDSLVSIVDSQFRDNSSNNRGGAVAVGFSVAYILRSTFERNRVNLPGHASGSPGGAIYVQDGKLRVYDSHFEDNQAGWTGGAIYAFGTWNNPVTVPAAEVLIVNSEFRGNFALSDPGSPPPGVTVGGALHAEDQTAMRVYQSRFFENFAERGGGADAYRALLEIQDSVFRGNFATNPTSGSGGTLHAVSSDFNDPSTNFGAINRPPAQLIVRNTLLQGRFGATGVAAVNGGCLSAAGDQTRMTGAGVPANGSAADNRAVVRLDGVVFHNCDVERPAASAGGFGGGVNVNLVNLAIEDSLFLECDAMGQGSAGGGLAMFNDSIVNLQRTTFADNSSERFGGAVHVSDSRFDVTASEFFGNEISPGESEIVNQSRGAAIFSIPTQRDVTGSISNSLFSNNIGLPVFEVDNDNGPVNALRYNNNRFFNNTFGSKVFTNILVDRAGSTVAQLNGMVVNRAGAGNSDKSTSNNTALGSAPAEGTVHAVPSTVHTGDSAKATNPSFLASAWARGTARLDGVTLNGFSDLRSTTATGNHALQIGSSTVDNLNLSASSCTTGALLCLNGERFRGDIAWQDFSRRSGLGNAEQLTNDTGYFWFFRDTNVEVVTKALNGTNNNGHYWLFAGALSNVEYKLTVLDEVTGRVQDYFNPLRNFASLGDTTAFPDDLERPVALSPADADIEAEPRWRTGVLAIPAGGLDGGESTISEGTQTADKAACSTTDTTLCLNQNRFEITVEWRDFGNRTGVGNAVQLTSDTGFFWFFKDTNVEVVIKVLNGTSINQHYWVFYGALSNVEYTIRVTDTETGFVKTYFNPLRNFASVGDTTAIPE